MMLLLLLHHLLHEKEGLIVRSFAPLDGGRRIDAARHDHAHRHDAAGDKKSGSVASGRAPLLQAAADVLDLHGDLSRGWRAGG